MRHTVTRILLPVSALVLTLFLFTPAQIFIGNFMEFGSLFGESLLVFLAGSLGLILVLSLALLAACRGPGSCQTLVSILSALAFLVWFQGNILVWQYGVLDGRAIEWRALVRYGLIDTAIWTAVVAFAVVKAGSVSRISRWLSLGIIVVQLLAVSHLWIRMPKEQGFKQRQRAGDDLYRFSNRVNVIIVVLDTFQSDFFQDIIREDAALAAAFDGFTYFRNALAGSDGTILSIPNMLTAANYDNSVPYLEYVRSSFLASSLPKTLTEYGFSIEMDPILEYSVHRDFSGAATGSRRLRDGDEFRREQALLVDLALFRCVPHFAKRVVYNRQQWLLSAALGRRRERGAAAAATAAAAGASPAAAVYAREFENSKQLVGKNRDARFIGTMLQKSGLLEDADAFRLYHLNGVHLALIMNENLAFEVMDPARPGMIRQGTGILKIMAMFLARLRQLAVYDNSLIFIVGDHGFGVGDAGINVSPLAATFNRGGPYPGNFKTFKAAGIPLVLVKRRQAAGALAISDAPVTLADIPQTVVEELGLDARFPGASMFGVREGEDRERIYRAFVGPQEDVEYLAPLYEYAVNGHSWDDASWRETGKIYYAPK